MICAVETAGDVFGSFFVLLIGIIASLYIGRRVNVGVYPVLFIYLWHTFFVVVYMLSTFYVQADSEGYYGRAIDAQTIPNFSVGTSFIDFLVYLLVRFLRFSYLETFLFFGYFGSFALIYVYSSIDVVTKKSKRFLRNISKSFVFLPGLSFWSASIGKDSIAALSVALFVWGFVTNKKISWIFISVFIMFLVRPHVALLMTGAVIFYMIFTRKSCSSGKVLPYLVSALFLIPVALVGLEYAGIPIQEMSIDRVMSIIENRQSVNQGGAMSMDLVNMSLLEAIFAYLFRPYIWDANSVPALYFAIENMLLILFALYCIFMSSGDRVKKVVSEYSALVIYVILFVLLMSLMTANSGIALRQKWMVLPVLYVILISITRYKQYRLYS